MSHCAYDSTDFGQVYWGLNLPQCDVRLFGRAIDDLAFGIVRTLWTDTDTDPYPYAVHGTRTCDNRLEAWCDNGRLVSKYSCLKLSYYQCSFKKKWLIPQSSTVVEFWRTPIQYNNENAIPQYSAADCGIMKNAPAMCNTNSTGDVQKAGEEYVV